MRDIWAIRHCEPVKGGAGICLGHAGDPPLSPAGLEQARALGSRFSDIALDGVYASPLLRSGQTAACIGDYQVIPDLIEQDYGEWDGLEWSAIKERYADLYAARGLDNSLVPPGAETSDEAASRYERALLATQGDCAAVVHKGALSALLCRLLDVSPTRAWMLGIPYGAPVLIREHEGRLSAFPSEADVGRLFERCETPDHVARHCRAVADLAREIAQDLADCGVSVSPALAYSAALVHDIARTQKNHPSRGAQILAHEGYPFLAAIVGKHHDAQQSIEPLDEAAIVFFADKLVCETDRVSLEERFARSELKCKTQEAREKHAAVKAAAERIGDELFRITGKRC